MFDSSSFVNPTPLAHADTSRDVLPKGRASQWHPTLFNLYDPEIRNARGFNVRPEVYLSGSENVTEFLEGIDNQIKLLEIPSYLSCAYFERSSPGESPRLVPNIRISVSAEYRHGLRTAEGSIVESIPCHPK
ncbi:uncharacterized protein TNCV_3456911 [Trichonephila clavipes]|nr:uncharacterized protein TNCV_3456911 [Trichonephila clavipes]